jgi:hypothetical protein
MTGVKVAVDSSSYKLDHESKISMDHGSNWRGRESKWRVSDIIGNKTQQIFI